MYKIIDNCLDQETFLTLKNTLLGADFPWYLNSSKVFKNSVVPEKYNYQFTHTFYHNYAGSSDWLKVIIPLVTVINPAAIVRIKANLTPLTSSIITYDFHVDEPWFIGKTAIYYVNTNNGYTEFENGQRIESVENRLVIFNSDTLHTGTSCTDEKVRCVLNLNYFEKQLKAV